MLMVYTYDKYAPFGAPPLKSLKIIRSKLSRLSRDSSLSRVSRVIGERKELDCGS